MSFESTDPDTCKGGLGSRICDLEQQISSVSGDVIEVTISGVSGLFGSPNVCFDFDTGDWTKDASGKFFEINILKEVHTKDPCPIPDIQKCVSGFGVYEYQRTSLDILWTEPGDIKLRVICDPDCRFKGRAIFDG